MANLLVQEVNNKEKEKKISSRNGKELKFMQKSWKPDLFEDLNYVQQDILPILLVFQSRRNSINRL